MDTMRSILVIRRDNIGDLVCTTPLLSALRTAHPAAWIGVLANSYNAPALDGNPDVDEVFSYRKLKHAGGDEGALAALGGRLAMLWSLRKRNVDVAVVAAGAQDVRGARFARMLSPGRIVWSADPVEGTHEVERTFSAARTLGYRGPIPPLKVVPRTNAAANAHAAVRAAGMGSPVIGIHISARRAAQRWPVGHFAALAAELATRHAASILLFWSPGAENDAKHPGDDGKARALIEAARNVAPMMSWPTLELSELVAGLSQCDVVVCSDGGAMHLAAGLGKPIACFFGDSPVDRWRPWGVPHVVLQAPSGRVEDVSVQETASAVLRLLHR